MHRSGALTTEARLRGPKSLVPFSLPTHPPGPSALLEHSVNTSELEPPLSSVCELCHPQAPKFMKCCISRSGSLGQSQKGGPVKPGPGLVPITWLQGPEEGREARGPAASPARVGSDLAHSTATACLSPREKRGSMPTSGRLNYLRHISIFRHLKVKLIVAQSRLTLRKSTGCSPPGSSVHGILQDLSGFAIPLS